jgi:hypothetical protein
MVTRSFSDDVPLNTKELAQAMRVSRWTVQRWKAAGYRFEFGKRTTAGHLKTWLRAQAAEPEVPLSVSDKEQVRLASALGRLR